MNFKQYSVENTGYYRGCRPLTRFVIRSIFILFLVLSFCPSIPAKEKVDYRSELNHLIPVNIILKFYRFDAAKNSIQVRGISIDSGTYLALGSISKFMQNIQKSQYFKRVRLSNTRRIKYEGKKAYSFTVDIICAGKNEKEGIAKARDITVSGDPGNVIRQELSRIKPKNVIIKGINYDQRSESVHFNGISIHSAKMGSLHSISRLMQSIQKSSFFKNASLATVKRSVYKGKTAHLFTIKMQIDEKTKKYLEIETTYGGNIEKKLEKAMLIEKPPNIVVKNVKFNRKSRMMLFEAIAIGETKSAVFESLAKFMENLKKSPYFEDALIHSGDWIDYKGKKAYRAGGEVIYHK